jgi:toxin ParE1/3/4
MRVIWAPRAIARAAEIAEYIAADRPAAAEGWVERLFAKAATLGRHARRGRKVPELERDDIRQVHFGKYRIIYRIDPRRVVLTVRHSRRQWDPRELEPDE